jgi:hypothetical protein
MGNPTDVGRGSDAGDVALALLMTTRILSVAITLSQRLRASGLAAACIVLR